MHQNTNFTNSLPQYSVGLDVGTSKICALVATKDVDSGRVVILGTGLVESEGLSRGVVTNIEKTVQCISKAVEQARQQSGIEIDEVTVGIAGDHVETHQVRSIITISNLTNEITENDLQRLIDEARNSHIPADRQIIHLIPQDYFIDGQRFTGSPIGISGRRLESEILIVTALTTSVKNIHMCVERAGLKVKELVLEPLASSRAILTEDEKEVGVAMVDIGGGTTDIAIFKDNIFRFTSIFGIAGQQVTEDIRTALNIVIGQAEELKKNHGHTFYDSIIKKDAEIMVTGINGRRPTEISKGSLCYIIQPRMEEIFEFTKLEIQKSGYFDKLGAGIVITGGAVQLQGSDELAFYMLQNSVKLGMPSDISISGLITSVSSPVFSTCVGLALWGLDSNHKEQIKVKQPTKTTTGPIKIDTTVVEESKTDYDVKKDIKPKKRFFDRIKEVLNEL